MRNSNTTQIILSLRELNILPFELIKKIMIHIIETFGIDVNCFYQQKTIIIQTHNLKDLLTRCRKFGDLTGQYVVSVRYLDTIDSSTVDNDSVRSYDRNVVWSVYCRECYHCIEYIKNVAKNPLLGIKIYHVGKIPSKRIWTMFGKRK